MSTKQEWIETLQLCSLTGIPADVLNRTAYDSETESDYESDDRYYDALYPMPSVLVFYSQCYMQGFDFAFDNAGRPRGHPEYGKTAKWVDDGSPFDAAGRPRGDPLFGKPLRYKPGDSSSDDDTTDSEDTDEEDSSDEDSSEDEVRLAQIASKK